MRTKQRRSIRKLAASVRRLLDQKENAEFEDVQQQTESKKLDVFVDLETDLNQPKLPNTFDAEEERLKSEAKEAARNLKNQKARERYAAKKAASLIEKGGLE